MIELSDNKRIKTLNLCFFCKGFQANLGFIFRWSNKTLNIQYTAHTLKLTIKSLRTMLLCLIYDIFL